MLVSKYITFSHVCTVIDDVTPCKEQKSTTRDKAEWCDCCFLHTATSSVIYYSIHTRKNVYLFYTIKIHIVWLQDFGGHEKRKTSLLTWIWRHLCVCPKKIMVNNQWKCTQKSRYCITLYRHMVAVIKKIYILTSVRVSAIRTSRNCFNDAHETMAPSQAWQWDRNAIYCDFS